MPIVDSLFVRQHEIAEVYEPWMRLAFTRAVNNKREIDHEALSGFISSLVNVVARSVAQDNGLETPAENALFQLTHRLVIGYVNLIQPGEAEQAIAWMLPVDLVERENRLQDARFLDKRSAVALERYRQHLLNEPVPQSEVVGMVSNLRRQLLQRRGNLIATTETSRAINAAVVTVAEANPESEVSLIWRVRSANTDAGCSFLDRTMVPVGTEFFSPTAGYFAHPPLHPLCRCVLGIRVGG